jgi:hypothetical protein
VAVKNHRARGERAALLILGADALGAENIALNVSKFISPLAKTPLITLRPVDIDALIASAIFVIPSPLCDSPTDRSWRL